MLDRLRIKNYRAFRDLEMPKLSRVNLVAGGNNSGKTSLLEAIFLLSGAGDPGLALHGNILRTVGDASDARMTQDAVVETLWKPLFYRFDASSTIIVTGDHQTSGHLSLKIGLETRNTVELALKDAGRVDLMPAE